MNISDNSSNTVQTPFILSTKYNKKTINKIEKESN